MEEITFKFTDNKLFDIFIYSGNMNFLYFLCTLIILDILTGLVKAIINKRLWSRKSLFGYARKILIFRIIVLANIIDQLLGLNNALVTATVIFYIANEGLSILENSSEMGIPVPIWIKDKLLIIRNSDENINEEISLKKETLKKKE